MARAAQTRNQPLPRPTSEEKAQFAERLRSLMAEKGLTIAETARRVRQHLPEGEGFDDTNLIHYRQGRSVPRPRHLDALSRALGVRPADLVGAHAHRTLSEPQRADETVEFAAAESSHGAQSPRAIQAIEDHGEMVLLKFEQLVPWHVALQILHALKDANIDLKG